MAWEFLRAHYWILGLQRWDLYEGESTGRSLGHWRSWQDEFKFFGTPKLILMKQVVLEAQAQPLNCSLASVWPSVLSLSYTSWCDDTFCHKAVINAELLPQCLQGPELNIKYVSLLTVSSRPLGYIVRVYLKSHINKWLFLKKKKLPSLGYFIRVTENGLLHIRIYDDTRVF